MAQVPRCTEARPTRDGEWRHYTESGRSPGLPSRHADAACRVCYDFFMSARAPSRRIEYPRAMPQHCPRCQRANPDKAVFCHFDGCLLQQGAGPSAGQLLQEFVFPSGRRCRSFDELVQGCYYEWEDARTLLSDGSFASYLSSIGRADLAKAAREGQALPDRDIALTNFVGALPATQTHGPKLGLSPRKLVIGPIRVGESRTAQVNV